MCNSYEGDDTVLPQPAAPAIPTTTAQKVPDSPVVVNGTTSSYTLQPSTQSQDSQTAPQYHVQPESELHNYGEDIYDDDGAGGYHSLASGQVTTEHGFTGTVGIKEDG